MTTEPSLWSGIEGVILDAVGTLIEPNPPVALVYTEAAARQGVVVDPAEIKRRFHQFFRVDEVDERLGPLVTDESTESLRWRRIVANVLPDLPDPDRAFNDLWDHFGQPTAWRAFDDVAPAIKAIRATGLAFVIASNFDGRLRAVVAGLPALAGCEPRLVISSEVGYRKPHPAFYLAACDLLELRPDQVLCIGDDPENDVRGPERAGLRAVLLDRNNRGTTEASTPRSLTEILNSQSRR